MANVLLTWEMGGGAGHCVKLAPIAQRLACAGHRISFAARDPLLAQRFCGQLPVTYYQAPKVLEKPANRIRHPRTMAQILHNTRFGEERHLRMLVRAWRDLFEAVQPDVVICDYSPTALLASRWHDHRRIILGTGFELPPTLVPLPDIEYWRSDKLDSNELLEVETVVLDRANGLLRRDGKQALEYLAEIFADVDLSYLMTLAELDHYPHRQSARYWGAWSPSGGCVPSWPNSHGPRIFGYLKPQRPHWELGGFLSILRGRQMATLMFVPGADRGWLQRLRISHAALCLRISRPPTTSRAVRRRDRSR